MSNFVSMASASGKWSKIVSINLPEILINDLLMLSKLPWLAGNKVKLAQTSAELGAFLLDEDTKVVLVAANNAGIAASQSIGFFVNIASFQEMTVDIVGRYFEIVRSNSAYLYCCNRELKILPGGERLEFSRYPWGTASILLDEPCKWHQFFYAIRNFPKFKTPYDGPLRHRLAKFPGA